jgi:hypothetical protein
MNIEYTCTPYDLKVFDNLLRAARCPSCVPGGPRKAILEAQETIQKILSTAKFTAE